MAYFFGPLCRWHAFAGDFHIQFSIFRWAFYELPFVSWIRFLCSGAGWRWQPSLSGLLGRPRCEWPWHKGLRRSDGHRNHGGQVCVVLRWQRISVRWNSARRCLLLRTHVRNSRTKLQYVALGLRDLDPPFFAVEIHTACLKNVTNLILNNFNTLEPISIIFIIFLIPLVGLFFYKSQLYFFTEPLCNRLYQSGVNDVSLLRHLFHRAWSTKPLISGVPGCVHMWKLKAKILNICHTPVLISVVI